MNNRSHNIRINIQYGLLQAIFWGTYCILVTNHNSYLLDRGYTNSEIGIMMVFGYIACVVFQPLLASLADRSKHISSTHVLLFSFGLLLISSFTLLFQTEHNFLITISYVILYSVSMWCQPFMNAYAKILGRSGANVPFAIWRGVGSASYAICAVIFGFVLRANSSAIMPRIGIFGVIGLIVITLIFLKEGALKAPTAASTTKVKFSIASYKGILIFFIGSACVSCGHMIFNSYLLQVITFLGGDESNVGIIAFYAALLEFPAVFIFHFLQKKFPNAVILKFGAICFFTKNLLYALAPSVNFLFIPATLQLLSFGLFNPASVEYINETVAPDQLNQGHSLSSVIGIIGLVITLGLSGIIMDHFTVKVALIFGGIVSFIGLFFIFFGIAMQDKIKKANATT